LCLKFKFFFHDREEKKEKKIIEREKKEEIKKHIESKAIKSQGFLLGITNMIFAYLYS
jgi:hypothetical protein